MFMRSRFAAILLASSSLASSSAAAFAQPAPPSGPYPSQQLVRITTTSQQQFDQAMHNVTAVWSCGIGVGPIDVQVTKDQLKALQRMGLSPQVEIADVQAALDAERTQIAAAHAQADAGWFTTYRTLDEINQHMLDLVALYPDMASSFNIGQSLEGRTTYGIRFSAPDQPNNPRSSRPAVFMHGCQHAREWISPMTNMYLADQMLQRYATDPRVHALLDRCEVIIIPVVNPDGYVYTWTPNNRLWRKNRRPNGGGSFGVDMNRNWGYQWGGEGASTDPNNETYRGTGPFSEVETQNLRDFIISEPRMRAHMDYHSFSQLVMSPWAWTATLPPDNGAFFELDTAIQAGIEAVHGLRYTAGPVYTTIYPASGNALDWTYGDRGILGMTIELRDTGNYGFILPANQIIPTGEENLAGALTFCEIASRPLVMDPAGTLPATSGPSGAPVAVSVFAGAETLTGVPRLVASVGALPPTTTDMTPGPGATFTGMIPGADCPHPVRYYFEATTALGHVVTLPVDAPASTFVALPSGSTTQVPFSDNMESTTGWVVGALGDTATAGLWERGVPQATFAQPAADATPNGSRCWMTGLAAGANADANDVDGGTTTLTSPRFTLPRPSKLRIAASTLSYARWYSNNTGANPGEDSMLVLISNDDGNTWTQLEEVTENARRWVTKSFTLEGIIAPTNLMRLRFVARDLGGDSTVECGVDDIKVTVSSCTPNLDLNNDGAADQGDVDELIRAVLGQPTSQPVDADFNQDGAADMQDIAAFIDALAGD